MTKEEAKKFYDYLKKDETIVNFDAQGWPNRKMDLRSILEAIGFGVYEVNGEKVFGIKSDAKVLSTFPTKLEDDGMGYGVHEQFVVSVTSSEDEDDKQYCHLFVETEMENKDMWYDNSILPGDKIKFDGHNVMLIRAINSSGKKWFEGRIYDDGLIPSSINVPEEYVKEYVDKNMFEDE